MSFLDFARQKIKPTPDQQNAMVALDKFFNSNKKCFLLKGYAGTGKTTITKTIAEYLQSIKYNPVLMAPTGRAARVLHEKTKFEATTIHKGIYNFDDLTEIEINKKDEKIQYKFRYNLRKVNDNIINMYLIDEASMISDKYSESEFFVFGSGILLQDLLAFIAPQNKARKDKIIFIGDAAQLPPVTDNISGALSAPYLLEKYDLLSDEYELTEVVRQSKDSGILDNATYLRNRLLQKVKKPFELNTDYADVTLLKSEEVADQYISLNPKLEYEKAVVISYSNKSALEYNLSIREKLFGNKYQISPGDILMINQNNYNYGIELLNGMMVKVLKISPVPELKSNVMSYNSRGEQCLVNLKFRSIKIEVPTISGLQTIQCLIMDDFLYSSQPALEYSEQIGLYLDFKFRNPHLKIRTNEFRDSLRNDPYFNALRVKYGYAVTCHKAQGGEWESAIINMDISISNYSSSFNRWLYTAITRAKHSLFLFNYKKQSGFSSLNYTSTLLPDSSELPARMKTVSYQLPKDMDAVFKKFQLENEALFKKEKLKELLARAQEYHCEIISRETHLFQERYAFEREGKRAALCFWYNGQDKFSKITICKIPSDDIPLANELLIAFKAPVTIMMIDPVSNLVPEKSFGEQEQQTADFFPPEYEALAGLYEELDGLLQPVKVKISLVQHNQYHEIYTIQRREERAVIQFYYNGLNQFTSAQNIPAKCNSNELLKDLESVINELKER